MSPREEMREDFHAARGIAESVAVYDGYKVAPGYVLIRMDETIKKAGAFDLPEEEKVNRGTVLIAGDHPVWWKALLNFKLFVRPGDRVVVGQIRQEVDKRHVICQIDHLLVKV